MKSLLMSLLLISGCEVEQNQKSITLNDDQIETTRNHSNDTYTKIAIETCTCMQPMIEKVTEYEIMVEHNTSNTQKQQEHLDEISKLRPQIEQCSDAIRMQYGDFLNEKTTIQKVNMAIKNECPQMFDVLSRLTTMDSL